MTDDPARIIQRASTKPDGSIDIDGMFAALGALAEMRIAADRARREYRREATNARRRERYAARKKAGTLPERKPEPEPDTEPDPGCHCASTWNPPCAWCSQNCPHDEEGIPVWINGPGTYYDLDGEAFTVTSKETP